MSPRSFATLTKRIQIGDSDLGIAPWYLQAQSCSTRTFLGIIFIILPHSSLS